MVRQDRLEWRGEVMAEDLPAIHPGQSVRIDLPSAPDADGPVVTGTVRQLAPTVDPKTRFAIVYVDLPRGGAARAGMFARGRIAIGQSDALTVPQDAIVMRDGFAHVLKLGEGDRVQLLRVQTGRLADGRVEITQGLDANARVVVRGGAFLNDGDLVQVVADSVPKVPSTPASPAQAASK